MMVESLDCDTAKHRSKTTLSAIKMLGTPYLCAFYVATAGLQGASLGSDEEEIVLLIYVIIDMTQNKVSRFGFHIVTLSRRRPLLLPLAPKLHQRRKNHLCISSLRSPYPLRISCLGYDSIEQLRLSSSDQQIRLYQCELFSK